MALLILRENKLLVFHSKLPALIQLCSFGGITLYNVSCAKYGALGSRVLAEFEFSGYSFVDL